MKTELLNLIPDDLLNLIWKRVKPSIKYCVNKYYFKKFYCYRFSIINNKYILNNYCNNYKFFIIKNYKYIKYLIINDCLLMIESLIKYKMSLNNGNYIFYNKIKFEDKTFKNFIDFCFFHSKNYNSYKIHEFILDLIKVYNLSYLVKKEHKNNNNNNYNNNNKNKIWIY